VASPRVMVVRRRSASSALDQIEGTVGMIVIGADTHKRTHALAAVDAGTGRQRGARQIRAEESGYLASVRWARGLDDERVWAIEDCRHVSRRFEAALTWAGERVVRVAAHRMGASRRGEREPGKSDEIDALAIARAVVRDGAERFPAAHLDQAAMEIRLLSDHRKDLVAERTRAQNRLRWHLLELCPELEPSLGRGALAAPRQLARVNRRLCRLPACARVRIAREQITQLRVLTRRGDALERELHALIGAHRPQLLAETGCGALTAALLIGRTAGAERFPSDASFARQTGTAPIPCSSGQRHRHRHRPRRRPPAQPRPAHDRHHPRPPRPGHPGLPGTQASRGQGQQGSTSLPQAPPRAPLPPPAFPAARDPSQPTEHQRRRAPRCAPTARHHDRQRGARTHALHQLRSPLQANIT
jgi:transposase